MLKHKDIIDNLTKEQKIALLTDTNEALGDAVERLNIPAIAINELWQENSLDQRELLFPSPKSLANTWDEGLVGNVAKSLATLGAKQGDNLFVLPSSNASSSAYGAELSEEPYLSGTMVAAMARALSYDRVPYCLKEPLCLPEDIRFLDKEADTAVLFDRIARPFMRARAAGNAQALLLHLTDMEGSYDQANNAIFNNVVPPDMEQLLKVEDGDITTAALLSGKQLIGGSGLAISTALENYNRIYSSMEEGGATAQELEATVANGAAISEETIDIALDKKLELASNCNREFTRVSDSDINGLAYIAAKESIVLVKNSNRVLPLAKGERLCIVGDIVNECDGSHYKDFMQRLFASVSASGASIMGFERGYDLNRDVSPELIGSACTMATSGTTTVAFVGLGAVREERLSTSARLALPGNQIAMLTALRQASKKLIVVVCGECLPDMSFDNLADAIILVPPQGAYVARALWDVMSGAVNPSGRLAYAGYYGVDTYVREQQSRKKKERQKIGPFIANRYADSEGERVPYPVGFGLSYTSFEYSRAAVQGRAIYFTVANTGRMDGCEVAQVYVGIAQPGSIRPRRELKGAVRIYLRAGERRQVSVPLDDLEIYDSQAQRFILEGGEYDIYVSSSLGNTKLHKKTTFVGATTNRRGKRLSDYLQNVSNIVSEGYTMEAYCKPMKTRSKLLSFGVILLITTLFADAVYAISCLMLSMDFMWYLLYFGIINGACLFVSLLSMIIGAAVSSSRKKKLEKRELAATMELFKNVQPADVREISQLFESEFDVSLDPVNKKEQESSVRDESTFTYMAVDTDIPTLCKELEEHFAEYGLIITPKMARKMLSAIMTSRLLVVRNALGVSCDKIVEILSRFFVTEPHTDDLKSEPWNRASLLRYNAAEGDRIERPAPLMQVINSATNEKDKAYFLGIANARMADLGEMLMPYVQYFGNPDGEYVVSDENGYISLSSNIWFVVTPGKGESLDNFPAFVANVATVVDLEAQSTGEAAAKTARKPISTHQLDALIFRAKKGCEISEDIWKSVDTLESFVNEKTPYHIGNKLFLQLEKYMAIYNACEADVHEAIDCAVSGKLLPAILNLLKGNEGMQETDLAQVVESIFGEEYATSCRNTIKRLVMDRAKAEKPQPPKAAAPSVAKEEPKVEAVVEPVAEPKVEAVVEPKAEPIAEPSVAQENTQAQGETDHVE